jgi:nucleoside-diphosphate-sugar epimerase
LKASPAVLKTLSVIMSVVEKLLPVPDEYSAEYLRTIAGVTYLGDYSKASRELGYQPRAFEAGLAETLHHEMEVLGMQAPALAGYPFGPTNA